jgi:hypothetical protein
VSETSGVGMPARLRLEHFGCVLQDAFGVVPYHVGSSVRGNNWRDVDVRLMLDDEIYSEMGFGDPRNQIRNGKWRAFALAFSLLGKEMTGLPIDFQIQQTSWANNEHTGVRSALGLFARGDL